MVSPSDRMVVRCIVGPRTICLAVVTAGRCVATGSINDAVRNGIAGIVLIAAVNDTARNGTVEVVIMVVVNGVACNRAGGSSDISPWGCRTISSQGADGESEHSQNS